MQSWKRGMMVFGCQTEPDLIERSDILLFAHENFGNKEEYETAMRDVSVIDIADIAILRMMKKHESFN